MERLVYDVETILKNLDIAVVKENGEELLAHCPAHERRTGKPDRHPSFWINKRTGLFTCWSCKFRGGAVFLVHYLTGMSFEESRQWVRNTALDLSTLLDFSEAPVAARNLRFSPKKGKTPPLEEMLKRGLHPDSVEHYGVTWDEGWIMPIVDPDSFEQWGVQIKTESYVKNHPRRVPKSRTLFGIKQFSGGQAIVVESPLDVVRLHSDGIEGGLACFGSFISDAQGSLILERADSVMIAMDNDKPGNREAQRFVTKYNGRINIYRFNYSRVEQYANDPGEMTYDEIKEAINNAKYCGV